MVPYKEDFAQINIPVLTIEGYYDDGQISGLHYMREHLKYNRNATHYLVIGPYDHFGTQTGGKAVLRDYKVDSVALIDTREITFQWLDYVLRKGPKPAILKDKINYEVMGANEWRHAPSLEKMSDTTLTFYLSDNQQLQNKKPGRKGAVLQVVDLADRKSFNNDYYPDPIIRNQPGRTGLHYISKPFDKPIVVNGAFYGRLRAVINKKDMNIGVTLYEVTPGGQYFELSYFLGCASYAKDPTRRQLLQPGREEEIPFTETRLVSRQLSKGSRLLVMLDIDKNPFAEINYGTGKDVSRETIADAGEPLQIRWQNDSYICVPVARQAQ
jgi:predicted acyl esterase